MSSRWAHGTKEVALSPFNHTHMHTLTPMCMHTPTHMHTLTRRSPLTLMCIHTLTLRNVLTLTCILTLTCVNTHIHNSLSHTHTVRMSIHTQGYA